MSQIRHDNLNVFSIRILLLTTCGSINIVIGQSVRIVISSQPAKQASFTVYLL